MILYNHTTRHGTGYFVREEIDGQIIGTIVLEAVGRGFARPRTAFTTNLTDVPKTEMVDTLFKRFADKMAEAKRE